MPNVIFITADGLRAFEPVAFIGGQPPEKLARLIVPKSYTAADLLAVANSDAQMPSRKYRYAGLSPNKAHIYEEIV